MEYRGSIYFDMDGTIADLYRVPNWLGKLRSSDPSPYLEAAPLVNPDELRKILVALRLSGYRIGIVSWLSMDSTKDYDRAVRAAKTLWLYETFGGFSFDEIHFIKYGRAKHNVVKDKKGLLFDDSDEVLEKWKGEKIDVKEREIIDVLSGLL